MKQNIESEKMKIKEMIIKQKVAMELKSSDTSFNINTKYGQIGLP